MTTKAHPPIPVPTEESKTFWANAKRHVLSLQRCGQCGRYRFYPRQTCPNCLSDVYDWAQVSGRGTIYSFTVVHRPAGPGFADMAPYVAAIIDLEEGARMLTHIVRCPPDKVKVGMPVRVVFEDVSPEIAIPKFEPASLSTGGDGQSVRQRPGPIKAVVIRTGPGRKK